MIPRIAALEMEEMEWNSGDEEQGGKKRWEVRKTLMGKIIKQFVRWITL